MIVLKKLSRAEERQGLETERFTKSQAGILKDQVLEVSRSMVWTGHSPVIPMESMGSDFSLAVYGRS